MKSSRTTNWIKWSEIECVMLPDKVVNSKLLKKILSIRVFDFSVKLIGCRTSGVKKCEHTVYKKNQKAKFVFSIWFF